MFDKLNEDDLSWIPDNVKNCDDGVQVKLLCGGDLLESFGTPGLWADQDVNFLIRILVYILMKFLLDREYSWSARSYCYYTI